MWVCLTVGSQFRYLQITAKRYTTWVIINGNLHFRGACIEIKPETENSLAVFVLNLRGKEVLNESY